MAKDGYIEAEGKVLEIIPGGDFKVKLENGHIVEARVSGKMRQNLIRIFQVIQYYLKFQYVI